MSHRSAANAPWQFDESTGPNWPGLVAGAGAAIGTFLSWISDGYGASWNGVDTHILDGWYALMLGGALVLNWWPC